MENGAPKKPVIDIKQILATSKKIVELKEQRKLTEADLHAYGVDTIKLLEVAHKTMDFVTHSTPSNTDVIEEVLNSEPKFELPAQPRKHRRR